MTKIFLKNTSQNILIEREIQSTDTVFDVRKYLSSHLNTDLTNIKVIFNGKLIVDNVRISALEIEDEITLNFVIKSQIAMTDDVEMKNTEYVKQTADIVDMVSVRFKTTGEVKEVDKKRIITKDGKKYLIKKIETRKPFLQELKETLLAARSDLVMKMAIVVALFLTSNREFAAVLAIMLLLRLINNFNMKIKMKNIRGIELVGKTILAFFVSLVMLNSDIILDFKSE